MSAIRSQSTDPWDEPSGSAFRDARAVTSKRRTTPAVPDSWDDDEDEAEELDNQRIWDDANTQSPMPSLVISSNSSVVSPPPAAFQPAMRILKRPSPPTSSSSSSSKQNQNDSLVEREARYRAARERIFGGEDNSTPPDSADEGRSKQANRTETPNPTTNVVRNPRGPNDSSSGGFKRRSAKVLPDSSNPTTVPVSTLEL